MEKIHHRSPGSVRVDRIRSFAFRDVTKADIEAVRDSRRAAAAATRKQGEVGINRLLVRCRHLFNWAIEEGYLEATPFKRGGQTVVRLTKETPRDRRLVDAGEEDRLLAAAAPHLKALIIAAMSTGCRLGELLCLQWREVRVAGLLADGNARGLVGRRQPALSHRAGICVRRRRTVL